MNKTMKKKEAKIIKKQMLFDSIEETYILYKPIFPPVIDSNDIVKMANQNSRKFPNAFIIYRTVASRDSKLKKHKLTVSQISFLAGKLWREEPNFVRDYY